MIARQPACHRRERVGGLPKLLIRRNAAILSQIAGRQQYIDRRLLGAYQRNHLLQALGGFEP